MQISVIIPVFNAAPFVEEAVQSALIQPETMEVILVDDGSTDGSYELCQQLSQNPKVRLFTHPNGANKRAGASRNLGIRHASYEYIAFLDADDYYLENRFAKANKVFQHHPEADGTYGLLGIEYNTDKGRQLFNLQQKETVTTYHLQVCPSPTELFSYFVLGKTSFSIDTMVLKKKAFNKTLLFNEELLQGQDTDFKLKWALSKILLPANIDQTVTIYRIHDNNTTHNKSEACKYKFMTYKPWVDRIKMHAWPSNVNRALFRHLLSGVNCHTNIGVRVFYKSAYAIFFLISRPWLILKLV